jgi:uncharacterized protein YqeY
MSAAGRFQQRLRNDLLAARRDRDEAATRAIRLLLSAVANDEAVPAPETDPLGRPIGPSEVSRHELDEAALVAIVAREIGAHRQAVDEYRALGVDTATTEAEVAAMERYLDE